MRPLRPVTSLSLVAGIGTTLGLLLAFAANGVAQALDAPQRIAFQISTGSTTGSYFPIGQALAQVLSHPPGVGRCQTADVCGPAGLIVSTRASEGSVANVLAVNSGIVSSGIAQADVVARAVAGQGQFKKAGPTTQLRTIANLYGENMHLVAAKSANIRSVTDLRGKRVSLSSEGSATNNTARAILAAFRLPERAITANFDAGEKATDLLQSGGLDAMFYVGGAPANLIEQLLDEGVAVLVPITGEGRTRLLRAQPHLYAQTIPEGTYSATDSLETVAVDALWITDASQPESLIYGMVKSTFNEANRATLNDERVGTHFMELASAAKGVTAPLHPGAARFFMEAGVLEAQPEAPPPPAQPPPVQPPPAPPSAKGAGK